LHHLCQERFDLAVWTDDGRDDLAAECTLRHVENGAAAIEIEARSDASIAYVSLRWAQPIAAGARILGDHWERAYGDLEWACIKPERVLPWYALIHEPSSGRTRGIGVQTGASCLASWRIDRAGISLVLDVRCGGLGVRLGDRRLRAATVHDVASTEWETPFAFARRFCACLCPSPRLSALPIYGGNDWYFRYGANSADTVRKDSALVRDLSPSKTNAPAFVIDAGWSPNGCDGGPFDRGTGVFPDMPGLAAELRDSGVRPGIWVRPLHTGEPLPDSWRLSARHPNAARAGALLDPSILDVVERVRDDIRRLNQWGFDVIKHDFTTFDLTGRWGFEMGAEVAQSGWCFSDRAKTTAEIVKTLYEAIREAAGNATIIGCNTIGHLGAGLFEIQRTGDDTSGRAWERTRKMGINALAFRMPQHQTFFGADADCVGLTAHVPWEQNRQWMELIARSGTPLFVSADPDAVGRKQRDAMRTAFSLASEESFAGEPLDWLDTTCPESWRFADGAAAFSWRTFPDSTLACP
jgi:alpha-galactosidase